MRKAKTIGICLAAAVAISMMTSTAAQAALPEWQQNKLPLTKVIHFAISGTTGQIVLGASKLTWSGVSGEGTIEGTNLVTKVKIIFTGSKIATCTVNSPGAGKAGEVVTKELKGQIGYINKATPIVGILLEPVTPATFLEVQESACNNLVTVRESIIGSITPLNTATTKLVASFKLSGGKDLYTKFEGEAGTHVLHYKEGLSEGEAPFECNEEELKTTEVIELKA